MTELLPVELWSQIFSTACLDGGRTACTLSEVSRTVRDIVLPFQLDNAAVIGPAKIIHFAALLRSRQHEPNTCRVRHLFLSYLWQGRGWHDAGITKEQYDIALRDIFAITAATLLTLTSTLPQQKVGLESVLCYPFSHLQELTIHGPLFNPIPIDDNVPIQSEFPALRYLHVLSSPENAYIYTSRAPALTHIRFSSLWRFNTDLYEAIDDALQPLDNSSESVQQPPPAPFHLSRSVEKILIETRIVPLAFRQGSEDIRRGPMMTTLQRHDKKGKLVLLDPEVALRGPATPSHRIERQEWENRLVGGPGCWNGHL